MSYMPRSPDNNPWILALETSGRVGSVALAAGPEVVAEKTFTHGIRHAVALMPEIRNIVSSQGIVPQDLAQVYVSSGPGSFTGVRIAISVARSLHLALGVKLVAVPTVDVLAQNAPPEVQNLVVVLDAKRAQVFAARYVRDNPHAPLRRVAGPALVDPTAFIRETPRPLAVLGEGVDYHRPALLAGVDNPSDIKELDKSLWPGRAAAVHALGWPMAQRGEFAEPDMLVPVYIRLAEAEEVWRKRHGIPI